MAKPKAQQTQQPRAISPEISLQPEHVRESMYMALQKFGSHKPAQKAGQLSLLDNLEPTEAGGERPEIEVTGLDLSYSEDRALHALQVLLERTDYKGNLPSQETDSLVFKWTGSLPRLAITYGDYFEAYGLERKGDASFYGHQAQIALEALESLQQPRTVYYKRKRWTGTGKGRKAVHDVIKATRPLIGISKGWQGLSKQEAQRVMAGQEHISGRVTLLQIEFSPLWVDGIDSFYLLKPSSLHADIQKLLAGKKPSRTISLFIEWLLTLNLPTVKIGKKLLAERLRMDYLLRQGHMGKLNKYLTEAFETAKELGFLLAWQEDATGMLIFELNPERCQRVKAGSAGEEDA